MNKIEIPKSVIEFIEHSGEIAESGGEEFFHLPFWYKKTDNPEVFEVYTVDELPKWLGEEINCFGDLKQNNEK